MTSINGSQHMASLALQGLDRSSDVMLRAMEKLSSGKRINRASDDAAGMAINLVHKAQTKGLGVSIKHASEAISVVNLVENTLGNVNDLLLRMRELSVQASADIYTSLDRSFMHDEINQINAEINRMASNSKFNKKHLLDGTYNNNFSISRDGDAFINLSVNPVDTSSIGSHELNTNVEITSVQNDHATAVNQLNTQFSSNADYVLKGANGTATITMNGGEDAREVARTFNLATGSTGVNASVVTRAKIKSVSAGGDVTFTLQGKGSKKSIVTAAFEATSNLTSLKDSINDVYGQTGVLASLSDDRMSINLVQNDGYNIIIGDVTSGANITVDAIVKNTSGKLVLKGDEQILQGSSGNSDSVGIVGQVTLSSSKAFSITPGNNDNHFNSSTSDEVSNFTSLNDIDLTTQLSASMAMERIDSSLDMISEMRSDLGAKNVRFQSIVNNLTNVELYTERHIDILEDANFGSETTKLAKSQVMQEASTAMIAQANNISKFMMSFLNMFKG